MSTVTKRTLLTTTLLSLLLGLASQSFGGKLPKKETFAFRNHSNKTVIVTIMDMDRNGYKVRNQRYVLAAGGRTPVLKAGQMRSSKIAVMVETWTQNGKYFRTTVNPKRSRLRVGYLAFYNSTICLNYSDENR